VLPCSARKPYRQSPSQRLYWRAAVQAVSKPSILERATLSGIYGIVPASFEDRVLDYDFNLNRASFTMGKHREIVGLLANRVACFLKQYGNSFAAVVAFGRERYWEVMHLAARDLKADKLWVIPRNKGTSLRREGLDELQSVLKRLAE
jgi:predicted RNA-binding protein